MRSKKGRRKIDGDNINYWQSYSDLMAALLLMFMLITLAISLKANMDYQLELQERYAYEAELKEHERIMQENEKIMREQEQKINDLIGIKAQIIEELSSAFEGADLKVRIDSNTGSIAFASSVLFDYDDAEIKKSGEEGWVQHKAGYELRFIAKIDGIYIIVHGDRGATESGEYIAVYKWVE